LRQILPALSRAEEILKQGELSSRRIDHTPNS
jgi:hypothetical protein